MPNIRAYMPADREACLAIFRSNLPKYFAPEELLLFTNWLDKPGLEDYFVLEVGQQVIGCGGYYTLPELQLANLAWGMIHQEYHGKGYGRQLTEFRLERMREKHPTFERRLSTSQHTFLFYQKMGYRTVEIIKDGFGPGLDKYVMLYT